jgi:hypothetical protein
MSPVHCMRESISGETLLDGFEEEEEEEEEEDEEEEEEDKISSAPKVSLRLSMTEDAITNFACTSIYPHTYICIHICICM